MLHARLRAAAGNRGGIPTDGLVAWYSMDNVSGSTLVDEQGAYNATIYGAAQVAGKIGQALAFDGSNDYVLPPGQIIATGSQIAISFWNYGYVEKESYLLVGIDSNGWRTASAHLPWVDGNVYWDCGSSSANVFDRISKAAAPADYQGWHHWVLQKDSSTGVMEIYKDRVLWHSETGKTIPITTTAEVNIGRNVRQQNQHHRGDIDQMLFYNRTLTASEIADIYNEGA